MANKSSVRIRPAQSSDLDALALQRESLWPDTPAAEHARELGLILAGKLSSPLPLLNLVAETSEHALIGFVEVGLRSHADGCDPSHAVGFIEGWYVAEDFRRKGVGGLLLAAAENWAREQGCKEMASDTWISSHISQQAHKALGYQVVDRCVHYRKEL